MSSESPLAPFDSDSLNRTTAVHTPLVVRSTGWRLAAVELASSEKMVLSIVSLTSELLVCRLQTSLVNTALFDVSSSIYVCVSVPLDAPVVVNRSAV